MAYIQVSMCSSALFLKCENGLVFGIDEDQENTAEILYQI